MRTWDVLLIGGASGVGKSSLAYPLARRHGIPVLEVDDIVCALKALTTPAQQPDLFFWDTHPQAPAMSPEAIMAQGLDLSRAIEPAIAAVIENHLETDLPIVIEGDFLLPSLLSRYAARNVKALFVVEDDEDRIVANYLAREPDGGEQRKRAQVSLVWDRWLRRATTNTIEARPWADLLDRADEATG
jgi:2-phosphoglycerate kinase